MIDVCSIGRRSEGIHRALLGLASENAIFYVHDTFPGADMQPFDHRQHREQLGNIAKRSRYFVVATPKWDETEETKGQVEIGYRYFEGSAAGSVLIGQAPASDAFRRMFPWEDAVIELHRDGSDVQDVLAQLAVQPERVRDIGHRNAAESLLRHDWFYRWKEILSDAGVELSPRMRARESRLKQLASAARAPGLGRD